MITRFAVVTLSFAAFIILAPAAFALPTIYIVSGVYDDGRAAREGFATVFACSNASGSPVDLRIAVLDKDGNSRGEASVGSLAHGRTATITTHATFGYGGDGLTSPGWPIYGGGAVIEASSSAVFCSAIVVDASDDPAFVKPSLAWSLHLVRIDPKSSAPPGNRNTAANTLYVISGIHDDGARLTEGVKTKIMCTNVSGGPVDVRVVVLHRNGTRAGKEVVLNGVPHGKTVGVGTRGGGVYATDQDIEAILTPNVGPVYMSIVDGVGIVEATSTAVFCSAFVVSSNSVIALNVERITPHPGTRE